MQIFLAFADEVGVFLVHGSHRHHVGYLLDYFGLFFKWEEIRHLAVVQKVANILIHGLVLDLGVAEKKRNGLLLQTHNLQ